MQCGFLTFPLVFFSVCNITISSREISARSGQSFGEIKSPPTLSGPAFCWYRFEAEPNERVEVQVYRVKRLGKRHFETNRCVGGFLQLVKGNQMEFQKDELAICGANQRYSPPIVQYRDFLPSENNVAVLLFKVEETTSRSQFLAHYSFTPNDQPDTGTFIRGGKRAQNEEFSDGKCPLSNDHRQMAQRRNNVKEYLRY